MNALKKLAKILEKSGGEGSRGGNIVGHTRTGKPIYSHSSHESHSQFKSGDHVDAMNQHHEIWAKTQDKIAKIKAERPNWNPPKQVTDFLQHHFTQMRMHQNRAGAKGDRENQQKKRLAVPTGDIKGPQPYNTPQNIHKGLNDIEIPFLAAVVVISPDKKKILLGKRAKDDDWESPAGHADIGERPQEVVIRECFEEFGVPLREEQLEPLPMMYKKDMTPIHCFMAITEKYQIRNVNVDGDPSEEHTKWKWFDLDGKLPEPMEDNRFNTIVHAKMRLAGVPEMQKSQLTMDDMEGMTTVDTGSLADSFGGLESEQAMIEEAMRNYESGDVPCEIPFEGSKLLLVKIDDGLFSGFVKRTDKDGLQETVANIDKLTIPAIVQFLRAKQIIKPAQKPTEIPKESQEDKLIQLLHTLMPSAEKTIYVSMDGDNIGNRVAQAEALDDEAALMEFSRRINAGQTIFHTWVNSVGGSIIEGGGDEALAKVPESAKDKIEFFRAQYEQLVGATVTVGVGDSISRATKARQLGKLKGKNRTEVFVAGSEEELHRLFKPVDEAQKIRDSGVLGLVKALLFKGKSHPVGTVRQWGVNKYVKHQDGWVVVGGIHDGKLMGNFLDEPTHGDYARHYARTSVREEGNGSGKDQKEPVSKAEAVDAPMLFNLTKNLQKTEEFQKAGGLEVGAQRVYQGMKYVKQGDGHWMPMPGRTPSSDEENLRVNQSEPTAVAQPKEEHEGATSEIPQSMADQSGESMMDHVKESKPKVEKIPEGRNVPDTDLKISKQNEEGALSHLEPREGFGGHVPLHSKDLKASLDKGPFSIISGGRNHNDPADRAMTDEMVNKRHKKLGEELADSGHKFTKIKQLHGSKTDAYMVHGADEDKMNEIGKKYNQESVIHSKGGKNKMAFTNGEHEGKWHEGNGYQEVPDAKDYYTSVDTSDGQKKKIDLGMDYGKHHKHEPIDSDQA